MYDDQIVWLFFDRSEQALVETQKKYGFYVRRIVDNILPSEEDCDECLNDIYMQEQAATALEQIKIFLEQKACFPLAEWTGPAPDAQDLTYGLLLDGIPVDVKMD